MRVVLDIAGDVQLNRELLGVSGRAVDMRPAFVAILDLWRAETAEQFGTEGQHASGGWKPLRPATAAAKRRRGQRPEILRATDALMRSLVEPHDGNPIARVTPSELEYGTKVEYAKFHQLGTRRMPRRRPVALTEGARQRTVKIVQRFLVTGELA